MACLAVSPLAWWAYFRQRPGGKGMETASAWLKPEDGPRAAAESG